MQAKHKTKQYWIAIAKISVLVGAFYVIYQKLSQTSADQWNQFLEKWNGWPWYAIFLLLFLSVANRVIEIYKWQNLAQELQPISWKSSAKQVLSALTAGIFTPNGIGEYGAKALFFPKDLAKRVVFLNLICNGIQMVWSILIGLVGLIYFNYHSELIPNHQLLLFLGILLSVIIVLALLRKIEIKKYSLSTLWEKLNEIPKRVHRKNLILGFFRYLSFSLQQVLLFYLFDTEIPFLLLFSGVAAVYLLASSLPTFQFLDFAVKGSVAVFFFGFLGINEWVIVTISTLMWFLNVVIPVTLGSYFILKFKSSW